MTPVPENRTNKDADALHAVVDLIVDAGPIPEEIPSKYGRGLLVQTSHEGQMDASRLWVQVKGTAGSKRHRTKSGGLRLRVPFDHAMRWIRALDLVVVVLWDVVEDVGWYAMPSSQVDPVEGVNKAQKSVTLRFAEDDVLTEEAVHSLVWRSRLEHHRLLVLSARDNAPSLKKKEGHGPSYERGLTALSFTDLVQITERRLEPDGMKYQVRPEVWEEFEDVLDKLSGGNAGERNQNADRAACEVTVRRWKTIEPKHDLPTALLVEGALVISDRWREEEDAGR